MRGKGRYALERLWCAREGEIHFRKAFDNKQAHIASPHQTLRHGDLRQKGGEGGSKKVGKE